MTFVRSSLFIALMLGLSSSARADENHYQNYLVGERAVGLGGAFTAISDDPSGAYYNPAGIADAPHSSLWVGMSMYGWVSEQEIVADLPADSSGFIAETANDSFIAYPTTAGWLYRLRHGDDRGVGRVQGVFTILTPTNHVNRRGLTIIEDTNPSDIPDYDLTPAALEQIVTDDESLWIGATVAWKPFRALSIGATLFGTMRTALYQFYSLEIGIFENINDPEDVRAATLPSQTELNATNFSLLGVFGAIVHLSDELSIGASVLTPEWLFAQSGELNLFTVDQDELGTLAVFSESLDAEFSPERPWRLSLGAAYLRPRAFGLSLDFSYYTAVGTHALVRVQDGDFDLNLFETSKAPVWQLSAGAEVYPFEQLALRAGFFTNRSSYEPCDDSSIACVNELSPFTDPTDRYGVTGSIGYERERATLTLAASYNFGEASLTTPAGVAVERSSSYLAVVIGGTFRFGDPPEAQGER